MTKRIAAAVRWQRWTKKLQDALLKRDQSWPRDNATMAAWANEFQFLEYRHSKQHIAEVLDWYCKFGCGALFVPLVGGGDSFCEKFDAM